MSVYKWSYNVLLFSNYQNYTFVFSFEVNFNILKTLTSSVFRRRGFCHLDPRKTSGTWVFLAPAAHVQRSITTTLAIGTPPMRSTPGQPVLWRSGTLSSCSTTGSFCCVCFIFFSVILVSLFFPVIWVSLFVLLSEFHFLFCYLSLTFCYLNVY